MSLEVSQEDLKGISSPEVINIIKTIKEIQKRMKDPDNINLQYVELYDKLSYEFNSFFERYTGIFVKVTRGEDLTTLASVLYYKDQVLRGLVTEEQLSDKLASTYLPANLKKDADVKMKELKEQGKL